MADKNSPPLGLTRKSFFCLFSVTSILFILSWFFVLRSTGGPHFIDHSLLPNSKLFSMMDNSNFKTRNHSVAETLPLNEQALVGDEEETPITTRATGSDPKESGTGTSSQRCKYSKAFIKVFMYDLPSEFHFGLLGWKPEGNSVWPDLRSKVPDYPGALNLQHSIEYWLTLDLLASKFDNSPNSRSAILVHNSTEADVIFVPFFSSLSYNRYSKVRPHQKKSNNNLLQEKLVKFVTEQEEWKRSGGRDHIVMAHHPNSLLYARKVLWPTVFILSDFGRYPPTLANVEKDIIAPYKHIIGNYYNDTSNYDSRPTLLYFQGAIYRKDGGFIRQELFYMLKDEEDVHFSFGSVQKDGISKATEGMRSSKFCLNIAGDTPSSNRLFDAIASHCVPVIISDEIELPFEDVLDYSEFCLFVRTSDALKSKFLISLIRSIGREEWTRMWRRLKEVENFFEFKYPSTEGDAVQMIWQAVTRKVPRIKLKLHKSWRFSRSRVRRERGLQWVPSPKNFS